MFANSKFGIASIVAAASIIVAAAGAKEGKIMEKTVRKPAVAGQFYTADPIALRAEIEQYFENARVQARDEDVVALVSPHAGYMYSGRVAASGYKLVRGQRYDVVAVISPSHTEAFPYSSIFPGTAYRTPLGDVPIDSEISSLVASNSELVKIDMAGHESRAFQRSEHALEVQLPFLQVALGDFKLVPIVMGTQSSRAVEALGKALGRALAGRKALIVASSDLSHFHSDREARSLDKVFEKDLSAFDEKTLLSDLAAGRCEACGGGPVAAAMIAARMLGATRCEIISYANSADVTGDRTSVVGYLSAAMIREKRAERESDPEGSEKNSKSVYSSPEKSRNKASEKNRGEKYALDRAEKIYLLQLARHTIAKRLGIDSPTPASPKSPILSEKRGAFVTLHKDGQLRGCIGYIEAIKPLEETVKEMAAAAAFNDWRFSPVAPHEFSKLEIEISVLSPIFPVKDPKTIEIGRHGLIVTRGSQRGLLLPQVAMEWGWDRETFLAQTCVKAGLPENAWKEKDTKLECFTAEVFSEQELGLR